MAIDEAMRHRIHGRLEELLGREEAAAFMSSAFPPDEHATKHDLDALGLRLERTMAELASTLRIEMNQQYRWTVQWVVGSLLGAGSLGLAAGRLLSG